MRLGCALLIATLIGACGLVAGSAWIGPRLFQEPEFVAVAGTAEDGIRCQQKMFEIARGGRLPRGGPIRPIAISEPELNAFLSRHLVETARIPLGSASVRLVGDGVVELKGQIPLRRALAIPELLTLDGSSSPSGFISARAQAWRWTLRENSAGICVLMSSGSRWAGSRFPVCWRASWSARRF